MTAARSRRLMRTEGMSHLEEALAQGCGVILVVSHVGNIDLAGTSQAVLGLPFTVAAKDIGNRQVQRFVMHVRERVGVEVIPPRKSAELVRDALRRNRIVTLAVDQHVPKHRAVVCDFFGLPAATSPSPARFALELDVPIITAVTWREPSGCHVMRVDPEFELKRPHAELQLNILHNTERLNRVIEAYIREHPEQWLWLHRRWKLPR